MNFPKLGVVAVPAEGKRFAEKTFGSKTDSNPPAIIESRCIFVLLNYCVFGLSFALRLHDDIPERISPRT
jgi:hypothetical protein